ncbi:glycine receptor subunit alpha-4-like [Eriocheir sinensis]|uniref:glycine receptor subunit alpha-4-like n=1 Tax=Eriocheir sinensis TaxID=95602 RepID=UPI0021C61AD6|nr:glycine receptor subunit alpha-4-like [Eriocheir sinensis]
MGGGGGGVMVEVVVMMMMVMMVMILTPAEAHQAMTTENRSEAEKAIPENYDKYYVPAANDHPVIVYFDMTLLDISSINENDMTFSVECFVSYRWKDWRLRWPLKRPELNPCWNSGVPSKLPKPLKFDQVCKSNYTTKIPRCVNPEKPKEERIILPLRFLEDIWQPDAFFKNGIKSSIHKDWVANEYLAFYTSDGHIRLFSRMSITLTCHFDFHHYPHDQQKCEMLIQSLSYKSDLVMFEWCEQWAKPINKLDQEIFSLPHFTLAKYDHEVCNTDIPCVKAVFVLVRHPDFHILHTYVPTVLIVILSWMSFWIAPDATPARVTLGVTSILTMATQYSQSTKNLPPVSYIKSLDIWMITCMVYVFMALLEFAIVYHVHYRRTQAPPQNPTTLISPQANPQNQVTQTLTLDSPGVKSWAVGWREFWRGHTAIDEASRVFFPLTYFSFVLGYFVLLTGQPDEEEGGTGGVGGGGHGGVEGHRVHT